MGSLPSHPVPGIDAASNYRLYASFCLSDPAAPAANVSNWLEFYNPLDNSWHPAGTVPGIPEGHALKDFAMIALEGSIFIIGGRLLKRYSGADGSAVDEDVAVMRCVVRHDVSTGEWLVCAPLATPRFNFAAAACDGKIYVAGGLCGLAGGPRGTSSAEVYDPAADQWAPLPSMSTRRYKCVGVAWQPGKVHIIGGFAEPQQEEEGSSSRGDRKALLRSSAEVFDLRRGEWELAAGMWLLDVPPNQIVSVGGRLYSSGDCLINWKGHIEAYDGKLGIWNILEGSHRGDLSSLIPSVDGGGCRSVGEQEEQEMMSAGRAVEQLYLTMAPMGTQLCFVAGYRLAPRDGCSSSAGDISVVHTFDTAASAGSKTRNGDWWRSSEPVTEQAGKELCGHCCVVLVVR